MSKHIHIYVGNKTKDVESDRFLFMIHVNGSHAAQTVASSESEALSKMKRGMTSVRKLGDKWRVYLKDGTAFDIPLPNITKGSDVIPSLRITAIKKRKAGPGDDDALR